MQRASNKLFQRRPRLARPPLNRGVRRDAIAERAQQEVCELHAFFGQWYRALVPPELERVSSALAPEFELLSPRGEILSKQRLIAELLAEHGAYPDLRISVENVHAVPCANGEVNVRYTEVHVENNVCERRRCCALLRTSDGAANGLAWVAIGEVHDA